MPVVALPDERFIIRSYSPQITIAGGVIIDALALRHRRKDIDGVREFLKKLLENKDDKAAQVRLFVQSAGKTGLTFADLQARTGWRNAILAAAIAENVGVRSIIDVGGIYIPASVFDDLKKRALSEIANYHRRERLATGIPREILREKIFPYLPPEIFRAAIEELAKEGKIISEKDAVKAASHTAELSADDIALRDRIRDIYARAKFDVPKLSEALVEAINGGRYREEHALKIFRLLLNSREIVKVSEEFYFSSAAIDELVNNMREAVSATEDRLIDVQKFKEIAGVSRKYAIPLLEYFDRERITQRSGDKRRIL